jgi:signal transduction histidine kinase
MTKNSPATGSAALNPTRYAEGRNTGIGAVGGKPWGSHFFLFYETKADLLDTLVPYFKAGLDNNEFCALLVSEPITKEEATNALSVAIPQFHRHLTNGNIEILPSHDFYLNGGPLQRERVSRNIFNKLDHVLRSGYDGMRGNGNLSWLQRKDWDAFCDYERDLNRTIVNQKMMMLCAYPLAGRTATEILDVTRTHQFAIARRNGNWEAVETSQMKEAKAVIKKLNEELKQRSAELEEEEGISRALNYKLLRTQDEERRRLALELHDSAGQLLAALKWKMVPLTEDIARQDFELAKRAGDCLHLLDELWKELRTVSYLLHPPLLHEAGLSFALRWYLEGLAERSGLGVNLELDLHLERPSPDVETAIFRIVQEALTNIHRHAKTKTARVRIDGDSENIRVEIEDKGRGIPQFSSLDDPSFKMGIGIHGMRERVRLLNGTFELRSGNTGTTIIVVLPAQNISKRTIES